MNSTKEHLILKFTYSNFQTRDGFQYPSTVGATVECKDFRDNTECGNGLHGFLNGVGDIHTTDYYRYKDFKSLVIATTEYIDLEGKVKFKEGVVKFIGSLSECADYIVNNIDNLQVMPIGYTKVDSSRSLNIVSSEFSTLKAGWGSTLKAGSNSTLEAGDYSNLEAGWNSTLKAGDYSTLKAGDNSNLEAGWGSTLKAGSNSTLEADSYSTLKAGDYSTLKAGDNSNLEAGWNSTLKAGDNSTLKAGSDSTLEAGDNSTLEAGEDSTLKAGLDSVLIFRTDKVTKVFIVDGNKVKADVAYRLNKDLELEEVK